MATSPRPGLGDRVPGSIASRRAGDHGAAGTGRRYLLLRLPPCGVIGLLLMVASDLVVASTPVNVTRFRHLLARRVWPRTVLVAQRLRLDRNTGL